MPSCERKEPGTKMTAKVRVTDSPWFIPGGEEVSFRLRYSGITDRLSCRHRHRTFHRGAFADDAVLPAAGVFIATAAAGGGSAAVTAAVTVMPQ